MLSTTVVDFVLAHPERVHALVPVDGGASGSGGLRPELPESMAQAAEGRLAEE